MKFIKQRDLPIKHFPEIKTKSMLRDYVISKGCYSKEENTRIYEKWFASAPRYVFRAVDNKYNMTEKIVCDVGCTYGMNIFYLKPGSYGIDLDLYSIKFAQSLGLNVFHGDIMNDEEMNLPKVEFIWCAAVLEHVNSPHLFLRKLHNLLIPNGMLALFIPTIPPFSWMCLLPGISHYFSAYVAADHINAFTPATLGFTCERAGFSTIEITPLYPQPFAIFNHIPLFRRIIGCYMYIGTKIESWNYPKGSTRIAKL
jgi:SAM-dependent methyltransferase